MRKKIILALLLVLLLCLAAVMIAQAQISDGFDLRWYVLSAGGSKSISSSGYVLTGTVGQTTAGHSQSISGFHLAHGFWQHFKDTFRILLPIITRH